LISAILFFSLPALAQEESAPPPPPPGPPDLTDSLIQDKNGNGTFEVIAFGDSITRGLGDFTPAGDEVSEITFPAQDQDAGYPLRLEQRLGIGVQNRGNSGEVMTEEGILRFSTTIPGLRPDVVIIAEGANDALFGVTGVRYWRTLQTMINIAQASGATPILTTIAVPCENHRFSRPAVEHYNTEIVRLAQINELSFADFDRAFRNTCDINRCGLYNLPDGLHPNTSGYDVMAETLLAAIFKIELFAADGPARLEQLFGLPPGTVLTKPDPAPPPAGGEGSGGQSA
jgi:lysophospholipase L1-like esterase